jgi:hypothetical protein
MEAAVLMRRSFELETWGDHQVKQKSQNAADEPGKSGMSTGSQVFLKYIRLRDWTVFHNHGVAMQAVLQRVWWLHSTGGWAGKSRRQDSGPSLPDQRLLSKRPFTPTLKPALQNRTTRQKGLPVV